MKPEPRLRWVSFSMPSPRPSGPEKGLRVPPKKYRNGSSMGECLTTLVVLMFTTPSVSRRATPRNVSGVRGGAAGAWTAGAGLEGTARTGWIWRASAPPANSESTARDKSERFARVRALIEVFLLRASEPVDSNLGREDCREVAGRLQA